jgi:hypothetical protein
MLLPNLLYRPVAAALFLSLGLLGYGASNACADNNLLVFSARFYHLNKHGQMSHYHLYTIRSDSWRKHQWTSGKSDDTDPVWLPGGRYIRFHREWQNNPTANGWFQLDTVQGTIRPDPDAPGKHDESGYGDPKIREKIEKESGLPCSVCAWGEDRYVVLTFQGKRTFHEYGAVPADVRELKLYNAQGELQKTLPISLPDEVKRKLDKADRPSDQLIELTPIPGNTDQFILGTFFHRNMMHVQLIVDTRTGKITYWSGTTSPHFSPDRKWFYTDVASGEGHRQFDVIGRRRNGQEIVEYVGELYIASPKYPDRQRFLIAGNVSFQGASWRP